MDRTERTRFNTPLIVLHWLALALIVSAYATNWLKEAFEHTPTEAVLQSWHTMFGISVLALVALRLAVRAVSPAPAIVPPPPRWQVTLATLVHVALYGLMIALPLTGWLQTNAHGDAVSWFGYPLPMLRGPDKALRHTVREVHETLATVGYALIGLHAAAALFHHYLMKDNTLRSMLPGVRAPQR